MNMQNPIRVPKNELRALYEYDTRERTASWMLKFLNKLWPEEMFRQLEEEKGEYYTYTQSEIKKFTKKTENAEIMSAIELSDFYFDSETNTDICFELRSGVSVKNIKTYDDLTNNLENDTWIDCFIKKGNQGLAFQIKRYPQEYLGPLNTESFLKFVKDKNSRYGSVKETILAILVQLIPHTNLHIDVFKSVHERLLSEKKEIQFAEIVLLYNDKNKNMVLRRIFPDYIAVSKQIKFKSAKYQDLQNNL